MKNILKVTLSDGTTMLLNEDMVISISPKGKSALVKMADGTILEIAKPSYSEWENDLFVNR